MCGEMIVLDVPDRGVFESEHGLRVDWPDPCSDSPIAVKASRHAR